MFLLQRLWAIQLKLITINEYQSLHSNLLAQYKKAYSERAKGGFSKWPDRRYAANGATFVSLVFRAGNSDIINKSEMSSMLGIKINHFPSLEARLSNKYI